MKNREAADLSRKRRKEQMSLLEERVQQLEQENTALKMHLAEYERQFGPLSNISNMALPLPVSSTATPSPRPSGRRVAFVLMFMVLSVFVVAARYQPSADSARAISSLSLHTGRSILSADIAVVPPAPTKKAEGRKVALSTVLQPADKDEGGNDAQDKEGDSKTLYPPFGINLNDSHTYVDTDDLRSWIDQAIAHAQPSQQPVPIQYQQHRQVAQNPHSADENNNAVALQTYVHFFKAPHFFFLNKKLSSPPVITTTERTRTASSSAAPIPPTCFASRSSRSCPTRSLPPAPSRACRSSCPTTTPLSISISTNRSSRTTASSRSTARSWARM